MVIFSAATAIVVAAAVCLHFGLAPCLPATQTNLAAHVPTETSIENEGIILTERHPLSDVERQLRSLQQYKSPSRDTVEGKAAAVAACDYLYEHINTEAIPLLIKNINLKNYPFDQARANQPTLDSAFRGPSIDQVFPAVHALKAYGADGADAIVDELIKNENFNRYAEPYNLLLEVFFCIMPREKLRSQVEDHLKSLSLSPARQEKYLNLFKGILQ